MEEINHVSNTFLNIRSIKTRIDQVFQQNRYNLANRLKLQHISSINIKRGCRYV